MFRQRVLITGAHGFIGSRLTPVLKKEYAVSTPEMNLLDIVSLRNGLGEEAWDIVVHLAAVSSVPICEKNPADTYHVNLDGTALLIDELQKRSPKCHLVFASTAQVYMAPSQKEAAEGVVFTEDRAVAPQNTYAKSKYAAELLIRDASQRWGLKSTILRIFNHTHHSQTPDFFLPHVYFALKNLSGEGSIPVGNLELSRDVGSVDDLVRAFVAVLKASPNAVSLNTFNVCSGTPKKLRVLAEGLAKRLGVRAHFEIESKRVRAGEPISIVGSHRKLTDFTGWQPHCKNEDDLLDAFLS